MSGAGSGRIEVRVHVDDTEDPPQSKNLRAEAVAELARHVLEEEDYCEGELDIVFCGDGRITELNETWLGREGPTDVMVFDLSNSASPAATKSVEGEMYVDLAQAERQAPQFEATVEEEVRRLVIHGILHLVGYDDAVSPDEAERMTERQEYYVAGWTRPVLEVTS